MNVLQLLSSYNSGAGIQKEATMRPRSNRRGGSAIQCTSTAPFTCAGHANVHQPYAPFSFSSLSPLVLQSMQWVVTGLAISLFSDMGPPQTSQMPKAPSSIRSIASRIFKINFRSLSRMRNSKFLSDSREALSLGSGKVSFALVISMTVFSAPFNRSLIFWVSICLKNSSFSGFIIVFFHHMT